MTGCRSSRPRLPVLCPSLLVAVLFAVGPAMSAPVEFSRSGPWQILYDPDVELECYMEQTNPAGVVLRFGLYGIRDRGFFSAMSKDWDHIDQDTEAELHFDFGDDLFAGTAKGFVDGPYRGGYAYFNNPEFIQAVAAKMTLSIDGNRRVPVHVDLTGTSRALGDVRRCLDMRAGQ